MRHRRLHGLGKLKDKENCEIHVFRGMKSATGKGMARKKVCYKRKDSEKAKRARAANLKLACASPKLPASLKEWCGVKAASKSSKRKSAKRAQLALPGMR